MFVGKAEKAAAAAVLGAPGAASAGHEAELASAAKRYGVVLSG